MHGQSGSGQDSTTASVRTMSDWRGEVETKLENNASEMSSMNRRIESTASEMSSMNKKIDFIIESLISKGQNRVKGSSEQPRRSLSRSGSPHEHGARQACTDDGNEKAWSASVLSVDTGKGIPVNAEVGGP